MLRIDVILTRRPDSGYCAFTHKAGIHAKAILNNPSTYEILKPEDFGLTRYVSIGYARIAPPLLSLTYRPSLDTV